MAPLVTPSNGSNGDPHVGASTVDARTYVENKGSHLSKNNLYWRFPSMGLPLNHPFS